MHCTIYLVNFQYSDRSDEFAIILKISSKIILKFVPKLGQDRRDKINISFFTG